MKTIIKMQSYSENFPINNCIIKVAVKKKVWDVNKNIKNVNQAIKTEVYENAIYENGFVSVDSGKTFLLADNFIFHKLKRTK
ncbi:hypothetical protein K9M42_03150 [Patescibacteria group bacterium]|nr:hypothetical protein [Patescibacteria group bacterium]